MSVLFHSMQYRGNRCVLQLWLKRLRKGDIGAIGELPSMVGNQDRSINITPFQSVASTLTDLIEYHQYLKAGLFNELGLNGNYNMKREAINSNESQLNDDMLHPLIDDMLKMRKEFCDQVNEMFGTNISVEFDSAWEDNELENEAALEAVEAEAEGAEDVASEGEYFIDESVDEEQPDVEIEEDEEVPEEEQTEVPSEGIKEEVIDALAEVIIDQIDEAPAEDQEDEEKEGEE